MEENMVNLTPEIMLKRFMRGREKHLYSEMRIQLQMRLGDDLGMRIYEVVEDDKIRGKINLILKDCLVKTFRFMNNTSQRQKKPKIVYRDLENKQNKKISDIDNLTLEYGFEGVDCKIVKMLMEGYSDRAIKRDLSISRSFFENRKERIKRIIKESNDV